MSVNDILRRAQETQQDILRKAEFEKQIQTKRLEKAGALQRDPSPLGYQRVQFAHDFLPGKTIEMVHGAHVEQFLSGNIADINSQHLVDSLAKQALTEITGTIKTVGVTVAAWHWLPMPEPKNYKSRFPWPKNWLWVEVKNATLAVRHGRRLECDDKLADDAWSTMIDARDLNLLFWWKIKSFDDAKRLLSQCVRDELRDQAFGDAEVYWRKNDVEIATGYFGNSGSSVGGPGWSLEGDPARALRFCGEAGLIERNDAQG